MSKATREDFARALRKFRRKHRCFYYTDFNDLPDQYKGEILGYLKKIKRSRRKSTE